MDTREITKKIRENGTMLGKIVQEADSAARIPFENPNLRNLVAEVSVKVCVNSFLSSLYVVVRKL